MLKRKSSEPSSSRSRTTTKTAASKSAPEARATRSRIDRLPKNAAKATVASVSGQKAVKGYAYVVDSDQDVLLSQEDSMPELSSGDEEFEEPRAQRPRRRVASYSSDGSESLDSELYDEEDDQEEEMVEEDTDIGSSPVRSSGKSKSKQSKSKSSSSNATAPRRALRSSALPALPEETSTEPAAPPEPTMKSSAFSAFRSFASSLIASISPLTRVSPSPTQSTASTSTSAAPVSQAPSISPSRVAASHYHYKFHSALKAPQWRVRLHRQRFSEPDADRVTPTYGSSSLWSLVPFRNTPSADHFGNKGRSGTRRPSGTTQLPITAYFSQAGASSGPGSRAPSPPITDSQTHLYSPISSRARGSKAASSECHSVAEVAGACQKLLAMLDRHPAFDPNGAALFEITPAPSTAATQLWGTYEQSDSIAIAGDDALSALCRTLSKQVPWHASYSASADSKSVTTPTQTRKTSVSISAAASASPSSAAAAATATVLVFPPTDYSEVVQEPVDLRTVRARVELTVAAGDGDEVMPSGGLSIYESLAQMVGDLRLCFDNAQLFFPPTHVRHQLATDLHRALDEALLSKSILVSQRPPTRGFGVFNQSVCTQPLATVSANFVHISMLNADETGGTALYAEGDDDSSDVSAQFVMPGIGTGSHYHGNNKNFPLLDIVCQRLGRRAGRLPDWYPVAWKRNIRRSFRYFTSVQDEQ